MKILTILRIIAIMLFHPITAIKKFSIRKIQVLFKALKYESSTQIITNSKKYFSDHYYSPDINEENSNPVSIKEQNLKQKRILLDDFLASDSTISFKKDIPILSIILVLYNKAELSLACLKSIVQNVHVSYEVIIVDNNSSDKTRALLKKIKGIKIIKNKENFHFLIANNQALEYVNGEYLLFLNNDTEINETTIPAAINSFIENENCGAIGAKLILPDGKLQEAGSIIWSDGSCLGYGRYDNPEKFEYNFKRITDYCSAAFLLTRTSLFKEYGGFDVRYEPAYYEETDYCLWLQGRGLHVIYNPNVIVNHFEFGSGISDSAIALQQKNQKIFYEKNKNQLYNHFNPIFSDTIKARFAASQKERKKILYIDDRIPHNNLGSGFPRSNSIVNLINRNNFDVTIYPLNFPFEDNFSTAYRDIDPSIEVAWGYGLDGFKKFLEERKNYYDVLWISRPHNMKLVKESILPLKNNCKVVYDAEAIFADRDITKKELEGNYLSNEKKDRLYENELKLSDAADVVISVSENDAQKFKDHGKKCVFTLGHALEISKSIKVFNDRYDLLFVGNLDYDASPNVDSLKWFIYEILPIIRKEIPDLKVSIVGSANSPMIKSVNIKGVNIMGKVDSIDDIYNQHRVFIAPTRFAAGIPFKIHEAASHGIPVVATQLLCNQLGWTHSKEIMVSKIDNNDFAHNVIQLYENEKLWTEIQKNAIQYIEKYMSVSFYKETILEILNSFNKRSYI